jgi:hypothetical protein
MSMMNHAFLLILLATNMLHAMETQQKELGLQQKIHNLMARNRLKIVPPHRGQRPNILQKGERHQGTRDCVYYTYDKNLNETLKDLENEGKVELDNSLFVQMANIIKNGQENEPLTLCQGWCESQIKALDEEERAYIAPCDVFTGMKLQNTPIISKGQWVIKDGENWMGLQRDSSIVSQSKKDWLSSMPDNLQCECDEVRNMGKADRWLMNSCENANIMLEQGRLQDWCMHKDK